MYPDFKDNIDFMRALYDVVVALGKCEQFEQAPTFYATIQPGGDQPWPLVIRSWKAPDGARHILVAHYYYSHGRLKPYPEFVVTYLGALVWQRSILEFTMVQPGDASRNYQLEMWAEALRNTYVEAAAHQRAAGKANLLLIPEDDVLWSIEEQRHPSAVKRSREERMADQQNCLRAFAAFLENREAARSAFVQATYLALRDQPEQLYLVCSSSGPWSTLSESDLIQRRRWRRAAPCPSTCCSSISFIIEAVTEQRKLLYSDLHAEASGGYGGYVTDTRTLPQIAQELGHSADAFIEQEVDWYLEWLLDDMRRKKAWYEQCCGLANSDDGDDTGVGAAP